MKSSSPEIHPLYLQEIREIDLSKTSLSLLEKNKKKTEMECRIRGGGGAAFYLMTQEKKKKQIIIKKNT